MKCFPQAHVFGHVVSSWWFYLGELVEPFEGGASLGEVSRSGWALGFYRPVPLPALSCFLVCQDRSQQPSASPDKLSLSTTIKKLLKPAAQRDPSSLELCFVRGLITTVR